MKPGCRSTVALTFLLLSAFVAAAQQTTPQAADSDSPAVTISSQSSAPETSGSQVRIVRISQVLGDVEINCQTGRGFESALANLPVVEASRLRTDDNSFAEVEFEDDSTLRLAPNSLVDFSHLELSPSGATLTTINVESGIVYVSLAHRKGNEFTLTFGNQKVTLAPDSHIRLSVDPITANLIVFGGKAAVQQAAGTMLVGKNKSLILSFQDGVAPAVAERVSNLASDEWDRAAIAYHKGKLKNTAYGTFPYAFGAQDMNYYGHFVNIPGCGLVWQPYFAGPGWDPYANGVWVWYPGSGYTWVSPYPWGWTPYHYGSWDYCGEYGWGWRPHGNWLAIANVPGRPTPRTVPPRHGLRPPAGARPVPPRAPGKGAPTRVTVNRTPLLVSGVRSGNKFAIAANSAGMGVPRGTLGNLGRVSDQFARHGSATIAVKPGKMGESPNQTQEVRSSSVAARTASGSHAVSTSFSARGSTSPGDARSSHSPASNGGHAGNARAGSSGTASGTGGGSSGSRGNLGGSARGGSSGGSAGGGGASGGHSGGGGGSASGGGGASSGHSGSGGGSASGGGGASGGHSGGGGGSASGGGSAGGNTGKW